MWFSCGVHTPVGGCETDSVRILNAVSDIKRGLKKRMATLETKLAKLRPCKFRELPLLSGADYIRRMDMEIAMSKKRRAIAASIPQMAESLTSLRRLQKDLKRRFSSEHRALKAALEHFKARQHALMVNLAKAELLKPEVSDSRHSAELDQVEYLIACNRRSVQIALQNYLDTLMTFREVLVTSATEADVAINATHDVVRISCLATAEKAIEYNIKGDYIAALSLPLQSVTTELLCPNDLFALDILNHLQRSMLMGLPRETAIDNFQPIVLVGQRPPLLPKRNLLPWVSLNEGDRVAVMAATDLWKCVFIRKTAKVALVPNDPNLLLPEDYLPAPKEEAAVPQEVSADPPATCPERSPSGEGLTGDRVEVFDIYSDSVSAEWQDEEEDVFEKMNKQAGVCSDLPEELVGKKALGIVKQLVRDEELDQGYCQKVEISEASRAAPKMKETERVRIPKKIEVDDEEVLMAESCMGGWFKRLIRTLFESEKSKRSRMNKKIMDAKIKKEVESRARRDAMVRVYAVQRRRESAKKLPASDI